MFKFGKWLTIGLIAVVIATTLGLWLPFRMDISADKQQVAISLSSQIAHAQEEYSPAYQVSIPEAPGNETGLKVFPPKLQTDGSKDNWLAVQSPQGLDVPVGAYTYDEEGDCIAVDKHSGEIYIDLTTDNLIITAGYLSDKCKYDIEVVDYSLYGGETIRDEEKQKKDVVTELRAKFRSYVYGSGSDLYQLENTPQRQEELAEGWGRTIEAVRIYAFVKAKEGVAKATASTRILIATKKFNGTTISLTSAEQRIETTYTVNPATGIAWTWQDIDDLQAGVTLKDGECSYIYVEVEFLVGSQTFYPITPAEVTPGTASAWTDVNVSAYVPSGATGVILHCVNTSFSPYALGLRKNGSTNNRTQTLVYDAHNWAAIGVDANRIFEAYVGSTTSIDIYLVGYTMSGVTFFTNAYDKSLGTTGSWLDINCSTEAPSATGLIFEVVAGSMTYSFGFRKNGSTDARTVGTTFHNTFGVIIGCDASQITEGYIASTAVDFFLVGYITDGCTFNTNATDVSLSTTGTWLDLTALPANANMGFIEVSSASAYYYGLRKNGSTEEIYRYVAYHSWAFVECDASQIIEGKIANVAVDFFVVGYSTAEAAEPDITVSPTSYDFGVATESTTLYTATNYFTITNSSTMQTDQTISVTTNYWDGAGAGVNWTHSDTCTPGVLTAGLKANRGGTWGTGDVIVKYSSPNYIYENCPANTNYSFGLKLYAPTSFDGDDYTQKTIIVKITAVAG